MFYIFNVKKSIIELYQNNPTALYKVLENIYYMHEEDINYGFNLFKQLTDKIKVMEMNNNLYIKLHKELQYAKVDNEHVINDLYHDEISILKIKSSHMILESNKSLSSFFNILNEYGNYFICDFKEKDYFFLNNVVDFVQEK